MVALASAYLAGEMRRSQASPLATPETPAPANVTLKSITVPVIANGAVQGYVLTQITVSVKPDLLKLLAQPAELMLTDEAFKTIYAEDQIDFKHLQKQNLSALSKKIQSNMNERAGSPLVTEVFIQELHYVNKKEEQSGRQLRR